MLTEDRHSQMTHWKFHPATAQRDDEVGRNDWLTGWNRQDGDITMTEKGQRTTK